MARAVPNLEGQPHTLLTHISIYPLARRLICALLLGVFGTRNASSQSTPPSDTGRIVPSAPADRVHGHIRDSSGHPISATVYVTRGSDRSTQQVTTDSAGFYAVRFTPGTGDYLVFASALGFQSNRRRVQRHGAVTADTIFAVDLILAKAVSALDTIHVAAQRPIPTTTPAEPLSVETGASESWKSDLNGVLPPLLAGNLNAIAGTMSNVTAGPNGPTVLGSGPTSTLHTLNGMAFASGTVPRAASTETRVTTTTYDPARGGFSGANLDVQLAPGSRDYQRRRGFVTLAPAAWQWTDVTGRAFGGPTGSINTSLGADGELIRRALTYNVAMDVTRTANTPATLNAANADALRTSGIAPDSVARLLAVASTLGVPLTGSGIPRSSRHDAITWLGRLDDIRDTLQTRALTTYVGFDRTGAMGLNPFSTPSTAGEQRSRTLGAQLTLGHYVGASRRFLTETRLAASEVHKTMTPYQTQPSATVVLPAIDANGVSDIGIVMLGGGSVWGTDETDWTIEGANETSWLAGGRRHHFKTQVWGRLDGSRKSGTANQFGSFFFNSIADFQANQPASFSRTLVQPSTTGAVWNTAASVTHAYTLSSAFRMLYGARLEADGFTSRPARNIALDTTLGVRSGIAPSRIHVSPRMGFSYRYLPTRPAATTSALGTMYARGGGILSGGIGEFRDILRSDLRTQAGAQTGLAGSTLNVSCVGHTVPDVDWMDFTTNPATIPSQCRDGSSGLSELAPSVMLIDPSYDVPRSWRASLDWSTEFKAWQIHLGSLASYSLNQPGTVDANFSGNPRFTLSDEAARPVYVSSTGIDPTTGSVSAAESRRTDQFGSVATRVSDLRGYGGQLTMTVSPKLAGLGAGPNRLFYTVGYTLQWVRRQYRGFDDADFGDPRVRDWAPDANDARHTFVLNGGLMSDKLGALTLSARLQSGLPFTPLVQGDVNGDGLYNDRAFIPDPASMSSSPVADQMRALLSNGTSEARHCVQDFLGRVAARNGCRGPWTGMLNLQWNPPLTFWHNRISPNVYVQNVLGGLDRALHGDGALRGWGEQAPPDAVLLIPRSFDGVTQRFAYEVNPRFGDTRGSRQFNPNPFQISMDFSVNLSTDYDLQQFRRSIEPVRTPTGWQPRPAAAITNAYLSRTMSMAKLLLDQSDSLFLDTAQISALERSDSVYSARVRALFVSLGEFLAHQDGHVGAEALDSVKATKQKYWTLFWDELDHVSALLTASQLEVAAPVVMLRQIPTWQRAGMQIEIGGYPVTMDR